MVTTLSIQHYEHDEMMLYSSYQNRH